MKGNRKNILKNKREKLKLPTLGFTLIELLGVIVILGLLGLIVYPNVAKSIKNSKEKLYREQVELIENSARNWGIQNNTSLTNTAYVDLTTLMNEGYIAKKEIKDPRTEEDMNGCVVITYNETTNQYNYNYVESTCDEASATPASCFTFDASTGTITDYEETCPKDVIIPRTIGGVEVKKIGSSAFRKENDFQITSVDFSQATNLTEIMDYAFYENKIANLKIPSHIKKVGNYAFCKNQLTHLILEEGVLSINHFSFGWNELTEVVIPSTITEIGQDCFSRNKLTNVIISDGIQIISEYAFYNNQLTNIDIPSSITTIKWNAFEYNQLTSVTIPNSVTDIGKAAFNNNQLPDDQAFIYARNSDGSIDYTTLVSYGGANRTNIIIPEGVTIIGEEAFASMNISEISIPESVIQIQNSAFGWNQLKNIVIPSNVTEIGKMAFYTNSINSITIPTSVTNIGDWAFRKNQLTSVTIKGKSSSSDFTIYGSSIWGWASGYSDDNIIWNP